jgi:hypothetical protein
LAGLIWLKQWEWLVVGWNGIDRSKEMMVGWLEDKKKHASDWGGAGLISKKDEAKHVM